MDFNEQITILQESIRMSHHSKRETKHKCITCDVFYFIYLEMESHYVKSYRENEKQEYL